MSGIVDRRTQNILCHSQIGNMKGVPQTLKDFGGLDGHFGSLIPRAHSRTCFSSSRTFCGYLSARFVVSFRSSLRLNSSLYSPYFPVLSSTDSHSFQSPSRTENNGRRRQASMLWGSPVLWPVR